MNRGEKESLCLEKVKAALFLNSHPCFKIDNETFKKDYILYCDSNFHKNYFCLLKDEQIEFANAIRTAQPNPSSNEFPDFIFDDGFIEHFQITSSQVTRKGSNQARKESDFRRKVDTETEKLETEWNETPSFDTVRSKSWSFQNPTHSHKFLIDSFKQNWENHIDSKKRFAGKDGIGIFMVEHPENSLAMCENIYCNWIDGMSNGDMHKPEIFHDYRLSRDKILLNYIYGFKNEIKYVIFVNLQRCEVIRTENIPCLLQLMPWDYTILPMQGRTETSIYNISVQKSFMKGDENNDKT